MTSGKAARFKLIDGRDGVNDAPRLQGISGDLMQISFGAAREVKRSHSLTPIVSRSNLLVAEL